MSHIPRSTGHRGGGIGILYKTCLDIRVADNCQPTTEKYNTLEHAQYLNGLGLLPSTVLLPLLPMALQQHTSFFEFVIFLEHLISLSWQIVIVGEAIFIWIIPQTIKQEISGTTGYPESESTGESTNSQTWSYFGLPGAHLERATSIQRL